LINIVVPMAGRGSRFAGTGERGPKPLIEVEPGRLMIDYVADYLRFDEPYRLIFVGLVEYGQDERLRSFMERLGAGHRLLLVEEVTAGPAATALVARGPIDNDEELLIAYCDGYLTIDMQALIDGLRQVEADGGVVIYPSSGPMDAHADLDGDRVRRVVEKQVISADAVAGVYYFRQGRQFVAAAERLLAERDGEREVFVSSTYNLLIGAGGKVLGRRIAREERIEMGTPKDLAQSRQWLAGRQSAVSAPGAGR
jgi:NDP-sugar pyrophosphorylase family protein